MTSVKQTSYDPMETKDSKESSYDLMKTSSLNNPHKKTIAQVDHMVDYLISKYGKKDTHTPFYRHVAWYLSDDTIRKVVGIVSDKNPNVPLAYFTTCVKRENGYYG